MQKIKAIIHLSNIRENAETFLKRSKTKLCAVVKANAYGHGAEEVANALGGVADMFAVALVDEGIALRAAASGKDILVFTPPMTEAEAYAVAVNGFIASVPDMKTAKLLVSVCEKYGLRARVHLKVNTGMNRYGMRVQELGKVCKFLKRNTPVSLEGIYSHLYTCALDKARIQREAFIRMIAVCKRYFSSVISHLGATYGALLGEEFAFDMVRVGIGLYGYLPITPKNQESGVAVFPELKKGMTVYAQVVGERKYACGGAGYGASQGIETGERLYLCRYGYADGFLRKRENGAVDCKSNANNLCMDVCIRRGEAKRGEYIPVLTDADETAEATDTISYEVLCAATRRAEFVYKYE